MKEMEQYTRHSGSRNDDRSGGDGAAGGQGFVVKDAPWDKQSQAAAPNTSSIEEFPSFGNNSMAPSSGGPRPSWGPRR
jgi:hypothetical protein